VTTVAYVDQLHQVSGIKLNQTNWRKLCFISILEADKVLRDKLVWNEDYKDLISDIDLFELRKMERAFLKYIEFNLTLSQSHYARYYFDLLSLREPGEQGGSTTVEGSGVGGGGGGGAGSKDAVERLTVASNPGGRVGVEGTLGKMESRKENPKIELLFS